MAVAMHAEASTPGGNASGRCIFRWRPAMPGSNAGSVDAAMRSRRVTGMSLSLDENLRTAAVAGGNKLCSCRTGQYFDDAASLLRVLVRRLRALEVQPIPDRETRGL